MFKLQLLELGAMMEDQINVLKRDVSDIRENTNALAAQTKSSPQVVGAECNSDESTRSTRQSILLQVLDVQEKFMVRMNQSILTMEETLTNGIANILNSRECSLEPTKVLKWIPVVGDVFGVNLVADRILSFIHPRSRNTLSLVCKLWNQSIYFCCSNLSMNEGLATVEPVGNDDDDDDDDGDDDDDDTDDDHVDHDDSDNDGGGDNKNIDVQGTLTLNNTLRKLLVKFRNCRSLHVTNGRRLESFYDDQVKIAIDNSKVLSLDFFFEELESYNNNNNTISSKENIICVSNIRILRLSDICFLPGDWFTNLECLEMVNCHIKVKKKGYYFVGKLHCPTHFKFGSMYWSN